MDQDVVVVGSSFAGLAGGGPRQTTEPGQSEEVSRYQFKDALGRAEGAGPGGDAELEAMMYVFRAVVGFAVAIVAIGGLWWFGTSALFRPLVPVEPAGSTPNAPVSGAAPRQVATPLAVEPRSAESGNRVYACRRGSEVVYADYPCGKDAAVQSLDPGRLNLYRATPAPEVSSNSPPAVETSGANPAGSNAPVGSANDNACASIEAQIRTIDERTRHPYTVQEGEELRSHRHRLVAQRWRLRCGW